MEAKELLITTCMSIQQYSACLWDYTSTNAIHNYKNGGRAIQKGLIMLGKDYLLTADADKPLLNAWLLNGHDPLKDSKFILPKQANCLAVCPNSVYLAAGLDSKLYLWHLSSGKLVTVQEKHFQPISVIKFSNDGIYLVVGGHDGSLVTYNFTHLIGFQNYFLALEAGQVEPLYSKTDHNQAISDMFIGNFGGKSRLATVSFDHSVCVYSLASGEMLIHLAFSEELTSVVFNDTCWNMFIGTCTGNIHQIKLTDPPKRIKHFVDETNSLSFTGHKQKVTCLAVNFDSTLLASGSDDCTVNIWQIKSRKVLKTLQHKGMVTNILFVMNHDNFFAHSYEPKLVIGKLERDFEPGDQMFDVVIKQDYDLDVDEDCFFEDKIRSLSKENIYLRAANKQLYDANMASTSKKLRINS